MRTIVVGYSVSGQTEFVADKIKELLDCDILKITTEKEIAPDVISRYAGGGKSMLSKNLPELKPYDFNPKKYENIVLCFPNWASNCPPAMKKFIADNKINGKNIYLFTTYIARGGTKCLLNVAKQLSGNIIKEKVKLSLPKKKNDLDVVLKEAFSKILADEKN